MDCLQVVSVAYHIELSYLMKLFIDKRYIMIEDYIYDSAGTSCSEHSLGMMCHVICNGSNLLLVGLCRRLFYLEFEY
jgi:hypothetical protein